MTQQIIKQEEAFQSNLDRITFEQNGPQPEIYTACDYASRSVGPEVGRRMIENHLEKLNIEFPEIDIAGLITRYAHRGNDNQERALYFEKHRLHFDLRQIKACQLFKREFKWLMKISPVDPSGITAEEYLHRLYDPEDHLLLLTEAKGHQGVIWPTPEEYASIKAMGRQPRCNWFWPHPIAGDPFIGEEVEIKRRKQRRRRGAEKKKARPKTRVKYSKNKSAIVKYKYAVAYLNSKADGALLERILRLELPIISITVTPICALELVLEADANSAEEWLVLCREFKRKLKTLNLPCGSFRFDWMGRLPNPNADESSALYWPLGKARLLYFTKEAKEILSCIEQIDSDGVKRVA